jgi:uncharacterized membrane protein
MSSHHRWLLSQVPEWEREGLIDATSAAALRGRYTDQNTADGSRIGFAQIAMGSLGALLIGAGLIAVIGYNWDEFTRPTRLLFAFLPLLTSQIFSWWVLRRGDGASAWLRETAGLLQSLTTVGCLAIVSQIYNLGGNWPDLLLGWMLLILPLAWVLRAKSVAMLYLIGTTIWPFGQFNYGVSWYVSPLIYPLLLAGLLPIWPGWPPKTAPSTWMRWMITPCATFGFCCAASFATYFTSESGYVHVNAEVATWLCTLVVACITLFPLNANGISESLGRKPQVILGALLLLGFGLAATFEDFSDEFDNLIGAFRLPWAWGLLMITAVFSALAVIQKRWAVLAIAMIAMLPLFGGVPGEWQHWLVTLYLAALGIAFIVLEFTGHRGSPRLGATLISLLTIARMAHSDFPLLTKGIIFIAVGIAFLVFNLLIIRHGRRSSPVTP